MFPPSNSRIKACVLVTKPMQNLKKVMGRDGYLAQHEQLQYHKDAVLRSMLFCESIENPQLSLPYKVSDLNKKCMTRTSIS